MTWLVEDNKGELHEILEDERVLVIGPNENYCRNWLLESHLPVFGSQFTVPLQWYNVADGNWAVIVYLDGWEFHQQAGEFKRAIARLKKLEREIFV